MSIPAVYFRLSLLLLLLLQLLSGCVTAPLNSEGATTNLNPGEVLDDPSAATGTVIWGGVIVSSKNLENRTQIEVLAYPLDNFQRPRTERPSTGRFLLQSPDYFETTDYVAGRKLTVLGSLQGVTAGEIDNAQYEFPTVTLNDVHLWKTDAFHEKPRFIFGIGINIGN